MTQDQKDSLTAIVSALTLIFAFFWFLTEPKLETLILVLSTVATTLTLFSSKKRIARAEQRYITPPRILFEVNVAFWGPSGSGKSWLISAFSRNLNLKYNKEINGLHYQFEEVYNRNFHDSSMPESTPTTGIDTTEIIFERSRTTEKFGQSISSFKHRIQVIDNPGDETTGAVLEEANTEENRARVLAVTQCLADSDIIIIALDPSRLDFWGEQVSKRAELIEQEKNRYSEYLYHLFSVLENSRPDKKHYYAVCLMKADKIPRARFNHPDGIIELIFGKKMIDTIRSIDPDRIRTFAVSSVGYLPNSTSPNYDSHNGTIQQPENWVPFGVEYPFFWAFEKLEQHSLMEKFTQSFWGKLTAKSKIKKYIPYPKPNYDL